MVNQITREEDRMLMEAKEIFKYLDRNIYNNISEKIRNLVENYNGEYTFEYNKTKVLNEQHISQRTKDFIVYIFYSCASLEDREKIKIHCENFEAKKRQLEQELDEKYSSENLFKKTIQEPTPQNIEKTNVASCEISTVKKQTFFSKIINKIKSIFNKKGY